MTPDLKRIESCRACGAAIFWTQTSTGKAMPVDASPSMLGNVLVFPTVDRKFVAVVLGAAEAKEHTIRDRHTSHFATCPKAAVFRKPKPRGIK